MSERLIVLILFTSLSFLSGCSSVTKLVKKILPGSNQSEAATKMHAQCAHTAQPDRHVGIAIKSNASDTNLLSAEGIFPAIKIGSTDYSISEQGISGGILSGPIPELDTVDDQLVAVQGQWADEQILVFAGSVTPKIALISHKVLSFKGRAHIEYQPAGESAIELTATAQITIDPDSRLVRFSILNPRASDGLFEKLVWTQIAYCDGQFQSTGSGRYRLIAASGRVTNLIGLSTDGPAGTAVLSGFVYGSQRPVVAALAFSLTGVTGRLFGVATMSVDSL